MDGSRTGPGVPGLVASLDSYLSLHTALHLRGLIERIPEVFYVVTSDAPSA